MGASAGRARGRWCLARRRGARGAVVGRACCAAAAEAVRGSAADLLLVGLKLRRAGARAALALGAIARTGARALLLLLLKTNTAPYSINTKLLLQHMLW